MKKILFLLFFVSPAWCMIFNFKHKISHPYKQLQVLLEKKREDLGLFKFLSREMILNIMGNLNYKMNMQLIMTCKEFYSRYKDKNDILFTKHCLDPDDYTDAMIHFAQRNDEKKVHFLMKHEGAINNNNREKILKYFPYNRSSLSYYSSLELTIDSYSKGSFTGRYDDFRKIIMEDNALRYFINKRRRCNFLWDEGDYTRLYTTLQYAIRYNDFAYVKTLLSLGSSVDRNIQGKEGKTALHFAVQEGKINIVELLMIDPLVNCNIEDNNGYTAYDYAEDSKIKNLLSERTSFSNKYCYFVTFFLKKGKKIYLFLLNAREGICIGIGFPVIIGAALYYLNALNLNSPFF